MIELEPFKGEIGRQGLTPLPFLAHLDVEYLHPAHEASCAADAPFRMKMGPMGRYLWRKDPSNENGLLTKARKLEHEAVFGRLEEPLIVAPHVEARRGNSLVEDALLVIFQNQRPTSFQEEQRWKLCICILQGKSDSSSLDIGGEIQEAIFFDTIKGQLFS